jgi:hypothetical protein
MIAGLCPPSFPAADNVCARVTSVMLPRRCSCAAGYSGDVSPGCSVTYCIMYIVCSTIAHQRTGGRTFYLSVAAMLFHHDVCTQLAQ